MKTAIVAVAVMVTGCATQHRYDYANLARMQPDCANSDAQLRFLDRQIELRESTLTGSNTPEANRAYVATAKQLAWDVRSRCVR